MSLFLTQMPAPNGATRRELHRTVSSGFAGPRPDALWHEYGGRLIVQSSERPTRMARSRSVDIEPVLRGASRFDLRCLANPVVNVTGGGRRPVTDPAAWFAERLDGADVEDVYATATADGYIDGVGVGPRIHAVELVAIVTVRNHDAFIEVVRAGVGRAKAWGFGMVMARPL